MPVVPAARRFAALRRSVLLAAAVAATGASSANAIVWREDLSDATVRNLSAQPQFNGVGIISAPGGSGTGTAIAPGWVLTAKHVVGNGQRIRFNLPGGVFNGTSIGDPGSDLALVRLDDNSQIPSTYNFITPNADHAVLGRQTWTVGYGGAGPVSQSANGGANLAYDFARRAGTNVVDSLQNTVYGPNSLIFSQSNTSAGSTKYEVSTAPGDSGGPMFLQSGNQWFVAGTTFGAIGGVGFVDANTAPRYSAFITANTGDIFSPRAAAGSLAWDAAVTNGSADGGTGSWNLTDTNFFDGKYNFAWDNGLAESAVFANAAGSVDVDAAIVFGNITFNATAANAYQLKAGSGTLAPAATGGTVTANAYARLNASLAGSGALSKNGAAAVELDGDNSAYNGRVNVNAGTLIVETAASFGAGGFDTSRATFVAGGATLQLRPNAGVNNGFISGEHLHLAGGGAGGNGAIYASGNGSFTLTERVALDADATVKVDAGSRLTFGGDQGRFYNGHTLTKIGEGVLVLDATTPNLVDALQRQRRHPRRPRRGPRRADDQQRRDARPRRHRGRRHRGPLHHRRLHPHRRRRFGDRTRPRRRVGRFAQRRRHRRPRRRRPAAVPAVATHGRAKLSDPRQRRRRPRERVVRPRRPGRRNLRRDELRLPRKLRRRHG